MIHDIHTHWSLYWGSLLILAYQVKSIYTHYIHTHTHPGACDQRLFEALLPSCGLKLVCPSWPLTPDINRAFSICCSVDFFFLFELVVKISVNQELVKHSIKSPSFPVLMLGCELQQISSKITLQTSAGDSPSSQMLQAEAVISNLTPCSCSCLLVLFPLWGKFLYFATSRSSCVVKPRKLVNRFSAATWINGCLSARMPESDARARLMSLMKQIFTPAPALIR